MITRWVTLKRICGWLCWLGGLVDAKLDLLLARLLPRLLLDRLVRFRFRFRLRVGVFRHLLLLLVVSLL